MTKREREFQTGTSRSRWASERATGERQNREEACVRGSVPHYAG
jgi:hypothetical protein